MVGDYDMVQIGLSAMPQRTRSKRKRPLIALTMGDAAGVGPEIIAGSWPETVVHDWCRPLVMGHPELMRRAVALWQTGVEVVEIQSPAEARPEPGVIPCLRCCRDDVLDVPPRMIDPRAGQAAFDAVATAGRLAMAGEVDAITTAPLHKKALRQAGHLHPGHTELLAEICGVSGDEHFAMMLYLAPTDGTLGPAGLAVVHVTLHVAMACALQQLSKEAVLGRARLADHFMTRLMGSRPRIGVCALNPHAGEGGLFGYEEQRVILPAIERGRAEGMRLDGPISSDAVFLQAREGRFDAVVAMYHDQGHIALKLMGMHRAVNVTLGLPIIRTSVAHGTALDIAWTRRAETGGMIEAIRIASRLSVG